MKVAIASLARPWWQIARRRIPAPAALAAKFRDVTPGERSVVLYRLAAGGLVGGYLLIAGWSGEVGGRDLLQPIAWLLLGFELAALAIFCHLLLRPERGVGRRVAGILLDLGALSYCMHVGGETAAPLYPVYLLVILTNGFRFGARYLLVAADVAVASFALVAVATPFFAAHAGLSLGLLSGLIVPALQLCAPMRQWRRDRAQGKSSAAIEDQIASGLAHAPAEAMPTVATATKATEPAAQAPASAAVDDRPPRRLAVLIAEDNVTSQKLMAKIIEKAGHEPHVVVDGQAAAEAVAKGTFDAVLMDLDLPVLNGIEAAKLMRFLSTGRPRIPIVGLSSDAAAAMPTNWHEAGIDACLAKPIEPTGLLQVLDEAVSARRAAASSRSTNAAPGGAARQAAALDVRTLESLKALGGDDFVEELAQQFIEDAAGVLGELSRAVASGDPQAFREHAHALRSGAANIGAQGVYDMCLAWRRIDPTTLSSKGDACVRALEQELGRVRAALQDYREYRAARKRSELAAPDPRSAVARLRA